MKNIVILISGRGSNMRAIVEACAAQGWPARVVAVVSNRPDAAGLAFAAQEGIATEVLEPGNFASREAYDVALLDAIECYSPDLVLLAGFMRVLSVHFVAHYSGRMLNVHPSLLPSFSGLKTHQRALDAGVRVHGTTVHFVTSELDVGPIVVQAALPVYADDDAQSLAARVLCAEHLIYPRAVRWFVEGRLSIDGSRVNVRASSPNASPESQWLFATEQA